MLQYTRETTRYHVNGKKKTENYNWNDEQFWIGISQRLLGASKRKQKKNPKTMRIVATPAENDGERATRTWDSKQFFTCAHFVLVWSNSFAVASDDDYIEFGGGCWLKLK